ncbi:MAG: tRNA (guanosine(18)-2'-O)-methyltransferase TrmH [Gemmatimonadetes bacterium]|nr:tRNA (guanosine(18)-2'-O)-methyltransferase TrmH [Gemmatimonadota bacterium]
MTPERYRRLRAVLDLRQPDLTVLMDRVHKPHNLSAILRSCDAVGVLEAHAIPPQGGLDVPAASSAGSAKWVRVRRHPDAVSALHALRADGFRLVAAHPTAGARDFRSADYTSPTAFLLGSELRGLGDDALELADECVVIHMVGMVRSLNVSVASALLLFEAFRQRQVAGLYERSRLDPERHRTLLFEWAYPRLARRLAEEGRRYPDIAEDGSVDPAELPR